MKKYIISLILLIATGLSPYITFAQTTEQNQNNACVNKVNGQDCTYDEQNPGMPPFTEDKEGKCDRRGDGRLYCNPDKTGWEDCFNNSLAGDACKTGGTTGGIAQLGTCKAQGSTFFCDTNNPPNTSPVTCGTTTCAAGEVCVNQGTTPTCTANAAGSDGKCGTATCTGGQVCVSQSGTPTCTASAATGGGTFVPPSNAPSTTAGNVSYESYTNFPGVGRIKDLCQLINALWLLGFVVLLTSVLGMFLYGGYIYVTAGVNAGKVNQAKEIFTNTITGLIIGLSIFIVINIINPGLLQGNCSIPSAGSGTPGDGGGGGDIPDAGTPCDSSNPNIKCIKPGEVSRIDITSCFYRNSNGAFHGGTDWVVAGAGNPVAILTAGQVVDVCRGSCGGFGNSVVIKGSSQGGFDLYNYSHMSSIASGIEKGMNLGRGTIVGIQGSTGSSTAAHVDTKISNCVLCKRSGSHFTQPTKVLMQYMKETYGVDPVCGCKNSCNDT